MCLQINVWNGVVNQVRNPNIDISSWRSAFEGLKNYPGFLIIEDEINEQFAIGQIAEIKKSSLIFRPFDADGVWQEELLIPYSSITHVSWNTRYANQWYEYLNRD